jgi:hypothetical protein
MGSKRNSMREVTKHWELIIVIGRRGYWFTSRSETKAGSPDGIIFELLDVMKRYVRWWGV